MTDPVSRWTAAGSRPCPACDATGTDWDGSAPCRCCLGTLWCPYPWDLPEDDEGPHPRAFYTLEEDAIVTAAPSHLLAYIGFCAVFGPVRSYWSIKKHRQLRRQRPDWKPAWSDAMVEVLDEAPNPAAAITALHETHPEAAATLSTEAIERKWYRLHPGGTRGMTT